METKKTLLAAAALLCAAVAFAAPARSVLDIEPMPVPAEFKADMEKPVAFDETVKVVLDVAGDDAGPAEEWLKKHFAEWFGAYSPSVVRGGAGLKLRGGPEAYAVSAGPQGVKIAARTIAGVRWAAHTIRQLTIAKRGTVKTAGWLLPQTEISDSPHLAFRAVHLCWFPEVRPQQIERAIRLAAMMKFNYAIVEPWGMYGSEKHPWFHWPETAMTKAEVSRLVALGRDLGITLIPQINAFGHASAARGSSQKHSVLDFAPEYEPLFEPGGWNWCLSNPETQRILREIIDEMHDNFGRPPFFHIGCDEAHPPSCPDCRKTAYHELVAKHISGLAEHLRERGARAMMWHDMLLSTSDPRWNGFVKYGGPAAEKIANALPKDIVICDWEYFNRKITPGLKWPTTDYFAGKGFSVAICPWENTGVMRNWAGHVAKSGGFGYIQTTWHHMSGYAWENMFVQGSAAAWGTRVPRGRRQDDVAFARNLRLVTSDMKPRDYRDTGSVEYQVNPARWP